MRDIALAAAQRADDADLLDALHDGDVGDDADHDGGDHKRQSGEGDQGDRYDIDDAVDHRDDDGEVIRIGDFLAVGFGQDGSVGELQIAVVIPFGQIIGDEVFAIETLGVYLDAVREIDAADIAKADARGLDVHPIAAPADRGGEHREEIAHRRSPADEAIAFQGMLFENEIIAIVETA